MNEKTLKMVKRHLQERLRKRMIEHPEETLENLVDAVCLECINFRLMLDKQKDALLGVVSNDPALMDMFLEQVVDDLQQLTEVEEDEPDTPDEQ